MSSFAAVAPSKTPAQPVRYFLFDNDCIQASFSDGTIISIQNDLCVYSERDSGDGGSSSTAGGATFKTKRNLLIFTRQNVRRYALVALEYLNQHVECPYLVDDLLYGALEMKGIPQDSIADATHYQHNASTTNDQQQNLSTASQHFFWTNTKVQETYWSLQDCRHIWNDGMDAGIQIKSREKNASVTLSPNGKLLKIVFPALVRKLNDYLEKKGVQTEKGMHSSSSGKYQYYWQVQYFSVHTFPQRWTVPVSMLLIAYAQQYPSNHTQLPDPSMNFDIEEYYMSEFPESKEILVKHQETPESDTMLSQSVAMSALGGGSFFNQEASRFSSSSQQTEALYHHPIPLHRAIQTDESLISFNRSAKTLDINVYLEYTPHYTYKYLGDNMLEILTHSDQNCIIMLPERQVLHYSFNFKLSQPSEKYYTEDHLPESVFYFEKQELSLSNSQKFISRKFPLREIVHLGKILLQTAEAQAKHLSIFRRGRSLMGGEDGSTTLNRTTNGRYNDGSTVLDPPIVSSEVLEETQLENVGTFTLYRDERVRARFVDRTLLTISPQQICMVIDRLGERTRFTQSNIPNQFLPYMSHALEFKRWALLSEIERHAEMQSLAEESQMLREGSMLREMVNETLEVFGDEQ